jgi:hypothetical protein
MEHGGRSAGVPPAVAGSSLSRTTHGAGRQWCHLNNTGIQDYTSFPRKRESTPHTFGTERLTYWIPAFAGMTCGLAPLNRANGTATRRHDALTLSPPIL